MAGLISSDTVFFRPFIILLITIIMTSISATDASSLKERDADTCPSSYSRCGSSKLPSNFCCSSSSTCISLDDSTSAICCPSGQDCTYIEPIKCDVQLQNATAHPSNDVKTTRLDDDLPKCGDACCPFGYTCQGNSTCTIDKATSSTATSTVSSAPASTVTSSSSSSSSSSKTSTATAASATDTVAPKTISITTSPSDPSITSSAGSLTGLNSSSAAVATKCPKFPSEAIIAGFFPGAVFGALATMLALFCHRRRRKTETPSFKVSHFTQRSSDGTVIGISSPIPSDEASYRTDFLLRQRRNSEGARSMLQRTGTRVKSLFGSSLKPTDRANARPPPLPVTPPRQIIPQRQPSTESIKVYSPPGVFANNPGFLNPEPYSVARTTTFTEMMERVGFQNNKGDPCYRVTTETPQPGARPRFQVDA